MSGGSFTQKQLRVTLTLGTPGATFASSGNNVLAITGLRMIATIQAIANQSTTADVQIYGLSQSNMDALTVAFFKPPIIINNTMVVETNDGSGWHQVFSGTVIEALPEYNAMPDVFFHVQGAVGYFSQMSPATALSYTTDVDVATVVADIASRMNLHFESNGISVIIPVRYFPGTLQDQLNRAVQAAGIDYYNSGGTLAICAKDSPRATPQIPLISAGSNMLGYPSLARFGVTVECVYSPSLLHGGQIQIQSDLKIANGIWTFKDGIFRLESNRPKGKWDALLNCYTVIMK